MTLARRRAFVAERRRAVTALGVGLAATALVVAGVPATAGAAETPAPLVGAQSAAAVEGEYLVVLERGASSATTQRAARRAEAAGGSVEQRFTHALDGYTATLSADELAEVRQDPSVAYVEAVTKSAADRRAGARVSRASSAPRAAGDPAAIRTQATQGSPSWNLDRIDQRPAGLDNRYVFDDSGGSLVTAYLVGTGAVPGNPDLRSGYLTENVNVSGDESDDACWADDTGAAGLLGGWRYGVAKYVPMVPIKITSCDDGGYSTVSTFVAAMDWIIANHDAGSPAVAEISEWFNGSQAVDDAVAALIADGVTVVATAGQPAQGGSAGDACDFSPGRVPAVITVGAVNAADQRDWRYSHSGSCVDLWAPGVNVETLYDGGVGVWELYIWWGSPFAVPHVAGTAANYLMKHPEATPEQVAAVVRAATTNNRLALLGTGSPNRLVYALPADAPAQTPNADSVASGTALRKSTSVKSPNGFYTLTEQSDGNLVLTRGGGRVTWSLGVKGSWVTMRPDGNLVMYDFGKPLWTSKTGGNSNSDLRVQDDGNLVVYRRSDNTATWVSHTAGKLPPKQPATVSDRLTPTNGLHRGGTYLQSANGRYRAFVHTTTGQLAVRDQTSGTYVFRSPAVDSDWVGLQTDGNLVLRNRAGTALWASGTGGMGRSDLVMRNDGNLVLYLQSTGKAIWSSNHGKV